MNTIPFFHRIHQFVSSNPSSIVPRHDLKKKTRKIVLVRETNRTTAFLESRKKEKYTTSSHTQSLPPRLSNEDIPLWNRKYTKPIPSPFYRWSAIAKRSRIDTASSRPSGTRTKKKKSRALEQRREEKAKRGVFDSTRPLGHTASTWAPFLEPRPGCGFAIEERWIHADQNLVPTISYSFREGCVLIRRSSPSNRYSIPFSISNTGDRPTCSIDSSSKER